jgi:hypothetical protein
MEGQFHRSFTHPLSNTIVLDKIDIANYLSDTMIGGLNISLLPVVMHEMTHHWCFSSPVGVALSLLALESRSKLMDPANLDDYELSNEISCSELTYNCTMSLMQPLMEGMAEFAEFDLVPGDSKVLSNLSYITAFLFLGYDELGDKLLPTFSEKIREHRMRRETIERKKALFANSFDSTQSSYLSGYLTVKALHRMAEAKYDIFHDADFFLLYLRSYFFDDWNFVKLLLSRDVYANSVADRVMPYFAERLRAFQSLDHTELARQFEEDVLNHKGVTCEIYTQWVAGPISSTPVGPYEFDPLVKALLEYRVNRIFESLPQEEGPVTMLLKSLMLYRAAVSLGHDNMKIRVTKGGMLNFYNQHGMVLLSMGAPKEMTRETEETVEVDVVYINDQGLYLILSKDGVVRFHFSINGSVLSDEQLEYFIDRNKVLAKIQKLNQAVHLLDEDAFYPDERENVMGMVQLNINNIYTYNSLIFTPDAYLQPALELLHKNGISSLIGDEVLVNDCVVASLIAANELRANSPGLATVLKSPGLGTAIEKINKITRAKLGFDNFGYIEAKGIIISNLF